MHHPLRIRPVFRHTVPRNKNKIASNKAALNQAASNQAALNQAASNQTASNQAASNQAASNQTASNQTASNQAASNQAASNQTASNQTASNQAASNQAASSPSEETHLDRNFNNFTEDSVNASQLRQIRKYVEVPVYKNVVKTVPRKVVIPVTKEVLKYVPRQQVRLIEQEKYIHGEPIEIPKIIQVLKEIIVPRYIDVKVPVVVAQTVDPYVTRNGFVKVEAIQYEPEIIHVDVYIPRPYDVPILCAGKTKETLNEVKIPNAQYNSIMRKINENPIQDPKTFNNRTFDNLPSNNLPSNNLPFERELDGTIRFLSSSEPSEFAGLGIPLKSLSMKNKNLDQANCRMSTYDENSTKSSAEC